MGRVPIVSVVRGRDAHSRLGLRIRGCRHIALLAHDENIIPKKSYCRITLLSKTGISLFWKWHANFKRED